MGFSIGGGIGGMVGTAATNAQIAANNRLSKINAETGNKTRVAQNTARMAEGTLARFVQSVNNNRALDAGANAQESLVVNHMRRGDANLSRGFSASIRDAEQAGHSAAAAAVAGVDGNVVDMVNGSTALRDSIVRQSVDEHQSMENYDASRRAGAIMSQMVSGLDSSVILDTLDYNQDVEQYRPETSAFANLIRGAFPAALDAQLGSGGWNGGKTAGSDNAATFKLDTERRSANAQSAGVNYDENYDNRIQRASYTPTFASDDSETSLWGSDDSMGNGYFW